MSNKNEKQLVKFQSGLALPAQSVSSVLTTDGSNNVVSSSVSTTTLGYLDATSSIQTQLNATEKTANKNTANGYAGLDGSAKIPASLLPSVVFQYEGAWNPATNTPALADSSGTNGFTYRVSTAFSGTISGLNDPSMNVFYVGDLVIFSSTAAAWQRAPSADGVTSVNTAVGAVTVNAINQLTGDVTTSAASMSQSLAATLATVNSNTGSFGSSTAIPSFTVNGKGLITAASTNVVIAPAGTLTGTTLASNVVTSSLTSLGTQAAALNMGSNQINAVADPSSATDATNRQYVNGYGFSQVPGSGGTTTLTATSAHTIQLSNSSTGSQTFTLPASLPDGQVWVFRNRASTGSGFNMSVNNASSTNLGSVPPQWYAVATSASTQGNGWIFSLFPYGNANYGTTLDLAGYELKNLTDPTTAQSAATKNYITNNTVASLNSLTGAVTLAAGTGITITPSGNTLTIASTGPIASAGDINETSFSGANNVTSATNVTGFAFANGTVRSFRALASVYVNATTSLYEVFDMLAVQKGSSWDLVQSSTGDNSLVVFSITNAGQIQYTDGNYTGFSSLKISFRAITTSV